MPSEVLKEFFIKYTTTYDKKGSQDAKRQLREVDKQQKNSAASLARIEVKRRGILDQIRTKQRKLYNTARFIKATSEDQLKLEKKETKQLNDQLKLLDRQKRIQSQIHADNKRAYADQRRAMRTSGGGRPGAGAGRVAGGASSALGFVAGRGLGAVGGAGIAAAAGPAAAAGLGFFAAGKGLKVFGEYESQLTRTSTQTNLTRKETEELGRVSIELSKTYGKAVPEIQEAGHALASVGFEGQRLYDTLEDVTKGSAAGLGDLSTVTLAATKIMGGFSQEALSGADALGLILKVAKEGQVKNVSEVSNAFAQLSSTMSAFGVSSTETTGLLAQLTLSTESPAIAATQLDALLAGLVDRSDEFGLSVDELVGRISQRENGLLKTLLELQQQAGATDAAFADGFGRKEASRGFLNLVKDLDDTWGRLDRVQQKTDDLNDAWKEALDDLTTLMSVFKAEFGSDLMEIGRILAPIAKTTLSIATNILKWGTNAKTAGATLSLLSGTPGGVSMGLLGIFGQEPDYSKLTPEEAQSQFANLQRVRRQYDKYKDDTIGTGRGAALSQTAQHWRGVWKLLGGEEGVMDRLAQLQPLLGGTGTGTEDVPKPKPRTRPKPTPATPVGRDPLPFMFSWLAAPKIGGPVSGASLKGVSLRGTDEESVRDRRIAVLVAETEQAERLAEATRHATDSVLGFGDQLVGIFNKVGLQGAGGVLQAAIGGFDMARGAIGAGKTAIGAFKAVKDAGGIGKALSGAAGGPWGIALAGTAAAIFGFMKLSAKRRARREKERQEAAQRRHLETLRALNPYSDLGGVNLGNIGRYWTGGGFSDIFVGSNTAPENGPKLQGAGGTGPQSANQTVNMSIYAAPGMSAQEVANAVSQKLAQEFRQTAADFN